ncbi:MAG: type II toxin-antitoxin system Phd/YefM family antitoxin [Clostridiales Family XIII bacterium]|jgi:PHD/YefM family antitoxin component YafN of YafNO toxin-antitoxin module|nr:type II toxin-antitoxin system Phd/YefM family antitoxin [Clostridiales Family XIII bacterium]
MPKIIPIKELKDTARLSAMIRETAEPIYVTKNGYGEMVIMNIETYENQLSLHDLYSKLQVAEQDFELGKTKDAHESISEMREKYEL